MPEPALGLGLEPELRSKPAPLLEPALNLAVAGTLAVAGSIAQAGSTAASIPVLAAGFGVKISKCTRVLRSPRRLRSWVPLSSRVPAGPVTRAWRIRPLALVLKTSILRAPPISPKALRSSSGARVWRQFCTGLTSSRSGTLTR